MIALRSSTSREKPRVPGGIRIYAVGDIHGRADLLDGVFERIEVDSATNPNSVNIEVFLGDYIDRGPASREVIDRLVERNRTYRAVFLKGNHETFLNSFASNPSILEDWRRLGGFETLMSYGVLPEINPSAGTQAKLAAAFDQALPISHRQFFGHLVTSFVCGDFFFAHAGVRPGIPLSKQSDEDLMWIRRDFLLYEEEFSKIIVHGHTPVSEPEIRPNRINIDTGAYATGRLTCLKLEDDRIEFV
jgi:serine/threonine protein phosphatase 1